MSEGPLGSKRMYSKCLSQSGLASRLICLPSFLLCLIPCAGSRVEPFKGDILPAPLSHKISQKSHYPIILPKVSKLSEQLQGMKWQTLHQWLPKDQSTFVFNAVLTSIFLKKTLLGKVPLGSFYY